MDHPSAHYKHLPTTPTCTLHHTLIIVGCRRLSIYLILEYTKYLFLGTKRPQSDHVCTFGPLPLNAHWKSLVIVQRHRYSQKHDIMS